MSNELGSPLNYLKTFQAHKYKRMTYICFMGQDLALPHKDDQHGLFKAIIFFFLFDRSRKALKKKKKSKGGCVFPSKFDSIRSFLDKNIHISKCIKLETSKQKFHILIDGDPL